MVQYSKTMVCLHSLDRIDKFAAGAYHLTRLVKQ